MDKKNIKIIEIQYFGNICYYLSLLNSSYIYFNNASTHFKGLNVNRTSVMSANKVLTLSVPIEGGRSVKTPVKDLKISFREPWQRIHWRSLHDSYRKAPWFEEYAPELEMIYQQNYIYLWDLNVKITNWVFQVLKMEAVILADFKNHHDPEDVEISRISSDEMGSDYPCYRQVFSDKLGFHPNLSIVDLIMNEGPLAMDYLKKLAVYHADNSGHTRP